MRRVCIYAKCDLKCRLQVETFRLAGVKRC